jgi:hypothetical protein
VGAAGLRHLVATQATAQRRIARALGLTCARVSEWNFTPPPGEPAPLRCKQAFTLSDLRDGCRVFDTRRQVMGTVVKGGTANAINFWTGSRHAKIDWDDGAKEEFKHGLLTYTQARLRELFIVFDDRVTLEEVRAAFS